MGQNRFKYWNDYLKYIIEKSNKKKENNITKGRQKMKKVYNVEAKIIDKI